MGNFVLTYNIYGYSTSNIRLRLVLVSWSYSDLKALLKQLESTLKKFAATSTADHIQLSITACSNVPNVIGYLA